MSTWLSILQVAALSSLPRSRLWWDEVPLMRCLSPVLIFDMFCPQPWLALLLPACGPYEALPKLLPAFKTPSSSPSPWFAYMVPVILLSMEFACCSACIDHAGKVSVKQP